MASKKLEKRPEVDFLFTDLPPKALRLVTQTLKFGRDKGYDEIWKEVSLTGEDSGINHGLGHAIKALEYGVGTTERCYQLSKVVCNFLYQLERELELNEGKDF